MNNKTRLHAVATFAAIACAVFAFSYARAPRKQAASGTLSIKLTTTSYGGKYADKNIGAIWIADAQDRFVKTLKLWANKRKNHLIKWNAASKGNVADAVTGATERSHGQRIAEWNCTNTNGALVADGLYKVYVEFTEDNSSSSGNPAGKWLVAEFTKGPSDKTVRPGNTAFFENIELLYRAGGTNSQPAMLAGNVLESGSNNALSGAAVQLVAGGQVVHNAQSDGSGAFTITDIAAGNYTLAASLSGYAPASENLTLSEGQTLSGKQIFLSKIVAGATLSGNVREAVSDLALSDVLVQLRQGGQTRYETRTDSNGNFNLANIPPGNYTLVVMKPGFASWNEAITLSDGQSISGKMISLAQTAIADTTAPESPANVRASRGGF